MKKILCVCIIMGVSVLSFAGNNGKNEKPLSNAEFMSQLGADLVKASTIIPNMEKELTDLRGDTLNKGTQINLLRAEKQNLVKLLASPEGSMMLVEYPLSVRFDSTLVQLSQKLIKYFGIAEKEATKDYCKLMMPYLDGYQEYNDEIYNMILKIQTVYFGPIKKNYPTDQFDKDIQNTKYCKQHAKDGIDGIPYLNDIVNRVQEVAQEGKLSKEFLETILREMK